MSIIYWLRDGKVIKEEYKPLTEEELLTLVRDKITFPSPKELYESGLIGGLTRVTYREKD